MSRGKTSGDLSRYPLPRLLLFISRKSFGGVLELDGQDGGVRVFFDGGAPVFCDLKKESHWLGRILKQAATITEEELLQCLEIQGSTGEPLGRIAVREELITEERLLEALTAQVEAKLVELCSWRQAPFSLGEGSPPVRLARELANLRTDPQEIVFRAIERHYDEQRLAREMKPLFSVAVKLRGDGRQDGRRRVKGGSTARLVEALLGKGYWLIDDLVAAAKSDRAGVLAVVYVLWASDGLDLKPPDSVARLRPKTGQVPAVRTGAYRVVESRSPDGGGGEAATPSGRPKKAEPRRKTQTERLLRTVSATPSPKEEKAPKEESFSWEPVPEDAPESVRALERELKERLESMQGQNLFDVLGVPPSASRKQVKDAYLVLAKKFHPDRVSSLGYEQLGEPADRLFQRISEAFTTLLDDSQREEYRQIVEDKSLAGGREKAREVLRAEIDFQKGEVFFKKGELDRAEEMFEAAVRGNPEEGEHLAMLAWTRHGKLKRVSKSVKPADREQLKQTLLDALKHSPKCARAHYFLGKLLLEEGKEQDALRSFERAVAIKPNYVEPAREINVMRLRKARRTKATKSSFWERLKGS